MKSSYIHWLCDRRCEPRTSRGCRFCASSIIDISEDSKDALHRTQFPDGPRSTIRLQDVEECRARGDLGQLLSEGRLDSRLTAKQNVSKHSCKLCEPRSITVDFLGSRSSFRFPLMDGAKQRASAPPTPIPRCALAGPGQERVRGSSDHRPVQAAGDPLQGFPALQDSLCSEEQLPERPWRAGAEVPFIFCAFIKAGASMSSFLRVESCGCPDRIGISNRYIPHRR